MELSKTIGVFILAAILSYGVLVPLIIRDYTSRATQSKVILALLLALSVILIMP